VTRLRFGVVAFLSIGVALVAPVPWLFGLIDDAAAKESPFVAHLLGRATAERLVFLLHIVGGAVALLAGPWQLLPRLRARFPRLHRASGYVYVVAVALSGTAGFALATSAWPGPVTRVGFGALAVLWLATTALGLQRILAGDRAGHRAWMVRSFALAFAAVSLRLQFMPYMMLGLDEATAYQIVSWSSWVPNLAIAFAFTSTAMRPAAATSGA
jgi:hypothetical protein